MGGSALPTCLLQVDMSEILHRLKYHLISLRAVPSAPAWHSLSRLGVRYIDPADIRLQFTDTE